MTIPLNSGIKLFGWCTCFKYNPSFLICFSGGRCSREDNRLKCFCSVCSVLWHPFKYFSTVVISELPARGIQCLGPSFSSAASSDIIPSSSSPTVSSSMLCFTIPFFYHYLFPLIYDFLYPSIVFYYTV